MRLLLTKTLALLLGTVPPSAKASSSQSSADRFEHVIAGPDGYSADPCVPSVNYDAGITNRTGIEFLRTPDEAFADLPSRGYPWPPNYVELDDGLRMHYLDVSPEGKDNDEAPSGGREPPEIVLMLHGQPTWSYLYRKMIPVLSSRGYRVIAPDNMGFGRSDKPTDMAQHTYLKQVDRLKSFIRKVIILPEAHQNSEPPMPMINLFVQDWGSLIGLRAMADEPGWFKRVAVANGLLPVLPANSNPFGNPNPVEYNCSDSRTVMDMGMERRTSIPCGLDDTCFSIWINFALTNPTWMPSGVLDAITSMSKAALSDEELDMYDAAFPSRMYMAGPRSFPSMMAAVYEPEFGNSAAWEVVKAFHRPFLSLADEEDKNLGSESNQRNFIDNVPGAKVHDFEHRRYAGAGHFIQEDAGEEVAEYFADFLEGTAHLFNDGDDTLATPAPSFAPTSLAPTVAPASSALSIQLDGSLLPILLVLPCIAMAL